MLIIFFLFGLIIGSFLNVVIYRLNLAESLMGRSHCPHCQKQIRWYDNIPLFSFILLGAKCRDCQGKISWQYPLIELSTGLVFALIANYFLVSFSFPSGLETVFYLGIFSLLLVIFIYDLKFMEIPMIIIWASIGWIIAYYLISDWLNFNPELGILSLKIFNGILGGVLAFLFFFALAYFSKEKWMGMGDAYLAFVVGLVAGWPLIFSVFVLSFGLGAMVSAGLLILKIKGLKSQVPFAPFFISGLFIIIFILKIFPPIKFFLFFQLL